MSGMVLMESIIGLPPPPCCIRNLMRSLILISIHARIRVPPILTG